MRLEGLPVPPCMYVGRQIDSVLFFNRFLHFFVSVQRDFALARHHHPPDEDKVYIAKKQFAFVLRSFLCYARHSRLSIVPPHFYTMQAFHLDHIFHRLKTDATFVRSSTYRACAINGESKHTAGGRRAVSFVHSAQKTHSQTARPTSACRLEHLLTDRLLRACSEKMPGWYCINRLKRPSHQSDI